MILVLYVASVEIGHKLHQTFLMNSFNIYIYVHQNVLFLKRNHLLFILKFSMVRQMISVFRISIRNPASFIHN